MNRRVMVVGALLAGTNAAYFGFVVLAGRILDRDGFALLTLCISAATLMTAFGDLGLTGTLARWFARHKAEDWAWTQPFARTGPLTLGVLLIGALILAFGFEVPAWATLFAAIVGGAGVALRAVGAGLLRATGRPIEGVLTEKGLRLLLGLAAGVLFIAGVKETSAWLATWVGVTTAALVLAMLMLRSVPRGEKTLPEGYWSGAWLYWIMSALYLAAAQWDRFAVAEVLGLDAVAPYGAVSNLTMGFEILTTAFGYVLLPRFGRTRNLSLVKESLLPTAGALLGVGAYALLGPLLLHLLFGGKYDDAQGLILPMAGLGFFRAMYIVPSLVIATRFLRPDLQRLFGLNVVLLLVHLVVLWIAVGRWQLYGAVGANTLIAVGRYLGGLWLIRGKLDEPLPEASA